MQKRLARIFIISLIGLLIAAYAAWVTGSIPDKPDYKPSVAGVKIGGPFELVDHNGKAVTDKDYAGKYKLIFFGFTYCPAICPAELQKITSVMNALDENTAKAIQPLFITIDPERDTPEVMKDYVSLFSDKIIGLTGSRPQIDKVINDYKIYAQKVEDPDYNDYMMDHSANIYLMSPDNELSLIFKRTDKVKEIVEKIQTHL